MVDGMKVPGGSKDGWNGSLEGVKWGAGRWRLSGECVKRRPWKAGEIGNDVKVRG